MTDQALKAAVEQAEREYARAYGLGHITVSVGLGTLRALLDALSSQASVMEEMAKGLEPFAAASDKLHSGYDDGIAGGDHPMSHVFVSDLRRARTALSQYRTLGDRHDD